MKSRFKLLIQVPFYSRARHGMYIIGNSENYSGIPMWNQVLGMLKEQQNLGPYLSLCCPRHPETAIDVTTVDDFTRLAPEGGCALPCGLRLGCGHACTFKCHSVARHEASVCQEPCPRGRDTCQHACPLVCGVQCHPRCQAVVKQVLLPCDHTKAAAKCYEAQNTSLIFCREEVEKQVSACGHIVSVSCGTSTEDEFKCLAKCNSPLPCGHQCQKACSSCRKEVEDGKIAIDHGTCTVGCGRPYTNCTHECRAPCHGKISCPPCSQPCQVSCHHSKCAKSCQEPCAPCAEICRAGCDHHGYCQLPCAVPCNLLPCSERCMKTLNCGHQCPSICGERCSDPRFCQICAAPKEAEAMVDFIECTTYREVDLDKDPIIIPACGHLMTRSSMDGHMELSRVYDLDSAGEIKGIIDASLPFSMDDLKSCPICRAPMRDIHRYNRIVKRGLIDEATKRFIVWANGTFVPLEGQLHEREVALSASNAQLRYLPREPIRGESGTLDPAQIELRGPRTNQIAQVVHLAGLRSRYTDIWQIRQQIRDFLRKVGEAEQPYGKVYRIVQDVRRATGEVVDFPAQGNILRTRERLLVYALYLRCDLTIFSDFIGVRQNLGSIRSSPYQWTRGKLTLDFTQIRKDCQSLAIIAGSQEQPMQEIEARVYFARFVILERTAAADPDTEMIQGLVEEARQNIKLAKTLCTRSPNTRAMLAEAEDVEKALRDSTFYTSVTSDEKRAVYAAMATEFGGTGHWYHCQNGHPFTVGECGMPMQTSVCPQCGAPVGGRNHEAVAGVTLARELDVEFGRLRV